MFCTTECWDCEDYKCKYAMEKELNNKLQKRIDKAIEYINSQSPDAGVSGKKIKEILKGNEDE